MNTLRGGRYWNHWHLEIGKPVMIRLLILGMVLSALLTSCETDSHPSPWFQENSLTISQYLNKHQEEYSKFYQLLVDARMLETLYAYNPNGKDWTLFLPTDEAIDQFINQNGKYASFEELLKDTVYIKKLTRYHILKKRIHSNEFPEGAFIDSTLTGDRIVTSFFAVGNDQLIKINNTAPIVKSNMEMTNGYIHIISEVLQPAVISGYTWLQQQNEYSILAKAMELSGVKKKLNWDKYTLFAEPDSIYHRYGIYSVEDLINRIATPGVALTEKSNAFYQFTSYHLLKGEYYLNDFSWGSHEYLSFSEQLITINVGQDIRFNTGVDTYHVIVLPSGEKTFINYIRPLTEGSNRLTRTGPVHAINELMYYQKWPR